MHKTRDKTDLRLQLGLLSSDLLQERIDAIKVSRGLYLIIKIILNQGLNLRHPQRHGRKPQQKKSNSWTMFL
jgi:hypothetical protein